ncbi:MAG TPA: hypothetical protein VLJ88_10245 [Propionibacteriaceae bacterium]|nr:hypothetical protein [Propionibacteriaceae bacterium]
MLRADLDLQIAAYAEGAELRIVNPDNPPRLPRMLRGKSEIEAWLRGEPAQRVVVQVSNLIEDGERIAFTEVRRYSDGGYEIAASTADLYDGLITRQLTILVWDPWD